MLTGGEARSEARIRAARRPECSATFILIEPDSAVGLHSITALGEAAAQVARLRVSGWVWLARSDADWACGNGSGCRGGSDSVWYLLLVAC